MQDSEQWERVALLAGQCSFTYTIPAKQRRIDVRAIEYIPIAHVVKVLHACGLRLDIKTKKWEGDNAAS